MIFESYYAALTAQLAVIKVDMPFKGLETLRDAGYSFGSLENTAFQELFEVKKKFLTTLGMILQRANSSWMRSLYKDRFIPLQSVEEGLRMAKTSDFAFLWPVDTVNLLTKDDPCSFAAAERTVFDSFPLTFAVKKGFKYKELFNYQ